jgi:hypothetical protein
MVVEQSEQSDSPSVPRTVRSWALSGKSLEALRVACIARSWGERELAEAAGIGRASASRILAGRPVERSIFAKVAAAIDESRADPAILRLLVGEVR